MHISNKQIVKKTVLEKPIDMVWQLWTTRQGLKQILGADNHIEITPGGAYEIYFMMDNPKGLKGSEGCTVLSFLPEKMLSFTWNAPPQYPKVRAAAYKTWVVVEFEHISEQQTGITLTHLGWPTDTAWQVVYTYFQNAWSIVFSQLENI